MEKPLVSVIINTYNHKDYISQAIESTLMQETAFPFEIIIGEDESNDGTREICVDYAEKYPNKIRLFLRSRKDVIYVNGCPTGRRNLIENLKSSEGKYVALLPGDDFWIDHNKLHKQIEFLENNSNYSICFHNSKVESNIKQPNLNLYSDFNWNKIDVNREDYSVEDLLLSPLMPTCSVVFRNKKIKFPSWFYKIASADMALFVLMNDHKKIKFFPDVMSCYRKHDKGVSANHKNDWIHMNRIYMYKQFKDLLGKEYLDTINSVIKSHRNQINSPVNRFISRFN